MSGQSVNATIYNSTNPIASILLTTSNDGSFETSFTNFSSGTYNLNASTSYKGVNKNCTDTFQVGNSASLILDKTATPNSLTNTTIIYNITLRAINVGGSDTLNTTLTDNNSTESPYNLITISPGTIITKNYLINFTRKDTTTYTILSQANVQGIDSYSGLTIFANSTILNITIPATSVGKNIVITKNIVYITETSQNITYNISSTLYNSGDENLFDISYIDSDIQSISIILNLTKGTSTTFSNSKVIAKAASNTQHQFSLGTATLGILTFYSNRPSINIPGYGGPADIIVYAPSTVQTSTSFDSIIEIKNMNPDIGQDFTINYWITNEIENTNYTSGQQTIYIPALGIKNITVNLLSPTTTGNYRLRASTSWIGGTATSFYSFGVVSIVTTPTPPSTGGGGSIVEPIEKAREENKTVPIQPTITEEITKPEVICSLPYIRHGFECCLDQNSNNICDEDEKNKTAEIEKPSGLTGFFLKIPEITKTNIEFLLKLLFIIIILILLLVLILKIIKKRKKDINRISYLKGLEVYTTNGIKVGTVNNIILSKMRIESLHIKLTRENRKKLQQTQKSKFKGISVDYKYVKAVKDVIIISHAVLEHLENIKTN